MLKPLSLLCLFWSLPRLGDETPLLAKAGIAVTWTVRGWAVPGDTKTSHGAKASVRLPWMKGKGCFNLAGCSGLDLGSLCTTDIQNGKWGGCRMWSSNSQAEGWELRTEGRGHCEIKILGLVMRRRRERKIRKASAKDWAQDWWKHGHSGPQFDHLYTGDKSWIYMVQLVWEKHGSCKMISQCLTQSNCEVNADGIVIFIITIITQS